MVTNSAALEKFKSLISSVIKCYSRTTVVVPSHVLLGDLKLLFPGHNV